MSWPARKRLRRLSRSRRDVRLNRWRRRAGGRAGVVGVAALAGLAAGVAGGLVAAVVAGIYAALAGAAWLNWRREGRIGRDRVALLDAIATLAADLRAGLSPAAALAEAQLSLQGGPDADSHRDRSLRRLTAAWQLSEQLGAPLADLLDRVESDLRAADRTRSNVAAQTAGARATTWVLAALPVAGIGLGYAMGVDPTRSLLHTPFGAACVATALVLQCAGLAWVSWLVRGATAEASG
jgi:tight adherence protein B